MLLLSRRGTHPTAGSKPVAVSRGGRARAVATAPPAAGKGGHHGELARPPEPADPGRRGSGHVRPDRSARLAPEAPGRLAVAPGEEGRRRAAGLAALAHRLPRNRRAVPERAGRGAP